MALSFEVESFVGRDASGGFGILPGRVSLMTVLEEGLSRFRVEGEDWQYLACPGGVLHFTGRELFLDTRRYLRDTDYQRLCLCPTAVWPRYWSL